MKPPPRAGLLIVLAATLPACADAPRAVGQHADLPFAEFADDAGGVVHLNVEDVGGRREREADALPLQGGAEAAGTAVVVG